MLLLFISSITPLSLEYISNKPTVIAPVNHQKFHLAYSFIEKKYIFRKMDVFASENDNVVFERSVDEQGFHIKVGRCYMCYDGSSEPKLCNEDKTIWYPECCDNYNCTGDCMIICADPDNNSFDVKGKYCLSYRDTDKPNMKDVVMSIKLQNPTSKQMFDITSRDNVD